MIQHVSVRCLATGLTRCARMTVWPIPVPGSPPLLATW